MTQAQILELLRSLSDRLELSMILISHDLSVIAEVCDSVNVMYAGKIVETGPTSAIFAPGQGSGPAHPYTARLRHAFPDIRRRADVRGGHPRPPARPASRRRPAAGSPTGATSPWTGAAPTSPRWIVVGAGHARRLPPQRTGPDGAALDAAPLDIAAADSRTARPRTEMTARRHEPA